MTARHDKATELAATVRDVCEQGERAMLELVWTMRNVNWRSALDELEALATGRATEGRTGAAAVDQAIATVRATLERAGISHSAISWTSPGGYCPSCEMADGAHDEGDCEIASALAALRVLADAVEELRGAKEALEGSHARGYREGVREEQARARAVVEVDPSFADWLPTCVLCGQSVEWADALAMPCSSLPDPGDDDLHVGFVHRGPCAASRDPQEGA